VRYYRTNLTQRPPPTQVEITDSDTPPRVKITVSPPRVQNEAAPPRVVQPTVTYITTPKSHRILSPTPCRAAEIVQQSNHVLSLPTGPTIRSATSTTNNTPVIIMPEMANALICPDTDKYLKHQELITMLRYKIKWMRSTANEIHRLYKTNTIRFV
jgi:hypothetical protein